MNNTILIIDDVEDNINVVSRLLSAHNYRILSAMSGKAALELLKTEAPDLILLDILMPDLDGFETCLQIKKLFPEKASTPIIFLTALTEMNMLTRAFDVGGVDYITKPIIFDELIKRVESQLKIYNSQKEIETLSNQLQSLNKILGDDIQQNIDFIQFSLSLKSPSDLEKEIMHECLSNVMNLIKLSRKMTELFKTGKVEVTSIDLQNCLNKALTILTPYITEKSIIVDMNIPPFSHVDADTDSLIYCVFSTIIQSCLSRIDQGSSLKVSCEDKLKHINLTIEYSGVAPEPDSISSNELKSNCGFSFSIVEKFINSYSATFAIHSLKEKHCFEINFQKSSS
ncbi:MAG: hybrid sensor histidine kinase/response regulator [Lentisphaeraceae bacterium]|nr:hybrid sensor histidine kinase/response regulator [Lentisphaeraceae bacterium]